MNILIVSATLLEVEHIILVSSKIRDNLFLVKSTHSVRVELLVTGIGLVAMAANLAKRLEEKNYDFVLNCGIAGAFNTKIPLATLFQIEVDSIADLGVEWDHGFIPLSKLGLVREDDITMVTDAGKFAHFFDHLAKAAAISRNSIRAKLEMEASQKQIYSADIESMEGAAFHYACKQKGIPYCQIRSISNYVGERDKQKWALAQSIKNLNEFLLNSFLAKL